MTNLLTYIRFLSRHKTLTAINITGLCTGVAICLFIVLYVMEELSYDKYHENASRIFSVTTTWTSAGSVDHLATAPLALAPELKQQFPEVEKAVRLKALSKPTVRSAEIINKEYGVFEADADVFQVFSYKMLSGDPATALTQPNSIVVTESFALKYFDVRDVLGKSLTIDNKEYHVTGILQDLPSASDLKFSALVAIDKTHENDWFADFEYHTFILFDKEYVKSDPLGESFALKLKQVADRNFNAAMGGDGTVAINLLPQALIDLHFRTPLLGDTSKGNIRYIFIISSVAFLVLVIASLNFVNFSLVQSLERGREVGIRKVMGSARGELMFRYVGESLFLATVAFVIAVGLVVLLMPLFNDVADKRLSLSNLVDIRLIGAAFAILFFVGVLAGSLPAFFTSSINPIEALKGKVTGLRGVKLRNVSITAQFAIAIGLSISTMLINNQMEFISNFDLGFSKENLLIIPAVNDSTASDKMKVLRQALEGNSKVKSVSNLSYGALPCEGPNKGDIKTKEGEETKIVNFSMIDEKYISTFNIKVTQGRNFELERIGDVDNVIVNEAFVRAWDWKSPLDEHVIWQGKEMKVIGVIKDFHFSTLYTAVEPLVLFYNSSDIEYSAVAFNVGVPVSDQVPLIQDVWANIFGNEPLEYRFFDESLAVRYLAEEKAVTLFTVFSILAIFISTLGLFGLCSLAISQRRKEIGVRKVLGAGSASIISLFLREYLPIIGLSFLFATPICIFGIKNWLSSFQHQGGIDSWVFFFVALCVIGLVLLAIVFSIVAAGRTSLAKLLRE